MTRAPTGYEATWVHSLAICHRADDMGMPTAVADPLRGSNPREPAGPIMIAP